MSTSTEKRNPVGLTVNKDARKEASPSHQEKPKTVAAIPCFNTEPFIAEVVSKARKYADQVIVIDDGSEDATAEKARAAGAEVLCHNHNLGYGEAVKSCFKAARENSADILVTLDGDGQHNPDEIPQLLAPALREEADLVIGSRFIKNGHSVPRYRRFGIGVITLLWNLGSKVKVSDSQSGFRVYRKDAFKSLSLTERGMGISIETLEKARRANAAISEVPISCQYSSPTPSLKAIKHGLGVALAVLRIRLRNRLFGST